MKRAILLSMLVVFSLAAYSTIWFVSPDGDDQNSGESWGQAFRTLRRGIYFIEEGDSLYCMQGAYYVHEIQIPAGVHVLGGFDGTELSYLERDYVNNKTVIDMDSDESSVVRNYGNIDGFYIQYGGTIINSGALQHCYIHSNKSGNSIVYNNSIIRNCGIYNNRFSGNDVYFFGSSALESNGGIVENCLIYANQTNGLRIEDDTEIRYVTSVGNLGRGLYLNGLDVTITNSIFANNDDDDIYGEYGNVNNCCYLTGTVSNGMNNVIADPLLVNIQGESDTWNLRLQPNSPCIDTGVIVEGVTVDIAGITRPFGNGVDMGAYEYYYETAVNQAGWMCYQ